MCHLSLLMLLLLFGVVAPVRPAAAQEENKRLNPIHALAWSPDSSKLAVGRGVQVCSQQYVQTYGIQLLDGKTGALVQTLKGSLCPTLSLDWSPDGERIVATTMEDAGIRVWDAANGKLLISSQNSPGYFAVKWSRDGKKLAVSDYGGGVYILDPRSLKVMLTPNLDGGSFGWSLDSRLLVTAGGRRNEVLELYDVEQDKGVYRSPGAFGFIDWSMDGTKILSGAVDSTIVRTWDAATGAALMTLSGHTSIINNAVWHPDSRHVASASDDGTVRIWDAETGKEIYRIDVGSRVYAVAWSPDGKQFAYGGIEGVVHIIPSPLMDATPEATPAP